MHSAVRVINIKIDWCLPPAKYDPLEIVIKKKGEENEKNTPIQQQKKKVKV